MVTFLSSSVALYAVTLYVTISDAAYCELPSALSLMITDLNPVGAMYSTWIVWSAWMFSKTYFPS